MLGARRLLSGVTTRLWCCPRLLTWRRTYVYLREQLGAGRAGSADLLDPDLNDVGCRHLELGAPHPVRWPHANMLTDVTSDFLVDMVPSSPSGSLHVGASSRFQ